MFFLVKKITTENSSNSVELYNDKIYTESARRVPHAFQMAQRLEVIRNLAFLRYLGINRAYKESGNTEGKALRLSAAEVPRGLS